MILITQETCGWPPGRPGGADMNIFPVPFTWSKSPRPRREPAVVAPVPRAFDFGFTARTPLVPLPAAMLFLNRKQRGVLALIESGELRWAFDIRSVASAKREVRVLRDSLFEYARLCPRECEYDSDEREFAEIMKRIFPIRGAGRRPVTPALPLAGPSVSAGEVARCLACTAGHVHHLVGDRLLLAPNRGLPGNRLLIQRASVAEFLWKRRMT